MKFPFVACFAIALLLLGACSNSEHSEEDSAFAKYEEPLRSNLIRLSEQDYFYRLVGNFDPNPHSPEHPAFAYNYLRDHTADEQLYKLLDHEHPLIRLYAFQAIKDGATNELAPLVMDRLHDTALVQVKQGDLILQTTVADVLIDLSFETLKLEERDAMRDSIFFKHQTLRAFPKILCTIEPRESYYPIVRRLARDEELPEAVLALAGYQNYVDLPIIRKALENMPCLENTELFKSVIRYPDTALLPPLAEYYQRCTAEDRLTPGTLRLYYQALASLKSKSSLKLLREAQTSLYANDADYATQNTVLIISALEKHFDGIYSDYFQELKQEVPNYKENLWVKVDDPPGKWN